MILEHTRMFSKLLCMAWLQNGTCSIHNNHGCNLTENALSLTTCVSRKDQENVTTKVVCTCHRYFSEHKNSPSVLVVKDEQAISKRATHSIRIPT